ncbi:hypothetical protein [Sphingomonas sp. KR3-1]|uniref:hypothetical protein n=1 Tax=Sphingomonas sp. KR3-1 TaxID=3156611 RepID=UPI0032B37CA4
MLAAFLFVVFATLGAVLLSDWLRHRDNSIVSGFSEALMSFGTGRSEAPAYGFKARHMLLARFLVEQPARIALRASAAALGLGAVVSGVVMIIKRIAL